LSEPPPLHPDSIGANDNPTAAVPIPARKLLREERGVSGTGMGSSLFVMLRLRTDYGAAEKSQY
jgi:hypothetical protein